jgi:hypothetical protein
MGSHSLDQTSWKFELNRTGITENNVPRPRYRPRTLIRRIEKGFILILTHNTRFGADL